MQRSTWLILSLFLLPMLAMASSIDTPPPADTVILSVDTVALPSQGGQVCVPIRAKLFDGLIAMQYSIGWDTELLAFEEAIIPGNLEFLGEVDFGVTGDSSHNVVWIDESLDGQTLSPGTILYELCFTNLSPGEGGFATIGFESSPTPSEFVDADDQLVPFGYCNGGVDLGDPGFVVWPGDTDENGVVNQADLLHIGVAFGEEGLARTNGSNDWEGQEVDLWGEEIGNTGIDASKADCDGNGIVNALDTMALVLNWGEETNLQTAMEAEERNSGPLLFIEDAVLNSMQEATLAIRLANEESPAAEIYGISFELGIDPSLILSNSISLDFTNSYLVEDDGNPLTIYRLNEESSTIAIAIVRTDGIASNDDGLVAHLNLTGIIPAGQAVVDFPLTIENLRMINEQGELLTAMSTVGSIELQGPDNVNEAPELRQVVVYPNLTKGDLFLTTGSLTVEQVELWNIAGQRIRTWSKPVQLSIHDLQKGMYYLTVYTDEGLAIRTVIKQ